jgi:hypothetical protein
MAERPLCPRCGWQEVVKKGLCDTDYRYERRTGRSRPAALIMRHLARRIRREISL